MFLVSTNRRCDRFRSGDAYWVLSQPLCSPNSTLRRLNEAARAADATRVRVLSNRSTHGWSDILQLLFRGTSNSTPNVEFEKVLSGYRRNPF